MCNADADLIMEWLVDFVLTRCNFWRDEPEKGGRNRKERDSDGYGAPYTRERG